MAIIKHRVTLEWPGAGSPGVNTWHGEYDEVAASSPQAQIDALKDFYTGLLPMLVKGMVIKHDGRPFAVDTLEEFPSTSWQLSTATTQIGLPFASMLCVSWSTGLRARRGMGRTFVGPLNRDVDDGSGTPKAGTPEEVEAIAEALVTASDGFIGNSLGVWGLTNKTPKGSIPDPEAPRTYRPFTGAKVADKYAVLRSRRD